MKARGVVAVFKQEIHSTDEELSSLVLKNTINLIFYNFIIYENLKSINMVRI